MRCLEARDFEAAAALFDDAVKLTPDHADAWACRGLALGQLKRFAESIDSFDKAAELNPNEVRVWLNRGIALTQWGKYKEAVASFDRLLELQPDDYCCRAPTAKVGKLGEFFRR